MSTEENLKKLEAARKELLSATYFFYEKLAFYSAGIISLSVTFVGYIVSKSEIVLFEKFLCLDLYQLLIISWAMLLLSLLLSISIRLWGAAYAARVVHEELLLGQRSDFSGHYNKLLEPVYKTIDEGIRRVSRIVKVFEFITKHAGWVSTTLFILGTILLLTFVVLSFLKI